MSFPSLRRSFIDVVREPDPPHGRGRDVGPSRKISGLVCYAYNEANGFGTLGDLRIFVHISSENPHAPPPPPPNPTDESNPPQIPAPNPADESKESKEWKNKEAVKLRLVHRCILPAIACVPVGNRIHTIYHAFTHSLMMYLKEKSNSTPLVGRYRIPVHPQVTQQTRYIEFSYLKNVYRTFFRGIVEALTYLHGSGYALSKIDIGNFVIHDNTLKLCLDDVDVTMNASPSQKKDDFKMLANVLTTLFGVNGPEEVKHLIKCMLVYEDGADDILLENHLCLLESKDRIALIKQFWEYRTLVRRDYDQAVTDMCSNVNSNWMSKFEAGEACLGPLLYSFNYQQGFYNVDQNNELYVHQRNIAEIRFCRNTVSHTLEHLHLFKLHHTIEDVELPIMGVLGSDLMEFQRKAHQLKVLRSLIQASEVKS